METRADTHVRLIAEIVETWADAEGPLLPILNQIQDEVGHIPDQAAELIGSKLNLSRAEVHGVISFYHDYRREPAGRHILKVCRAEACQSVGGREVAAELQEMLGLEWGETAADGAVTLEAVYCLGLCACAPAAMIDGRVLGRLDRDRAAELAREVRT